MVPPIPPSSTPPPPLRQLSRVSSSVSLLLPPRGLLDLSDGMCSTRAFLC